MRLLHRVKDILHQVKDILHQVKDILHRVKDILHRVKDILHRVKDVLHQLKDILHRVKDILHRNLIDLIISMWIICTSPSSPLHQIPSTLRMHATDSLHHLHGQGQHKDWRQGHLPVPVHQEPGVPACGNQDGVQGGQDQGRGNSPQGVPQYPCPSDGPLECIGHSSCPAASDQPAEAAQTEKGPRGQGAVGRGNDHHGGDGVHSKLMRSVALYIPLLSSNLLSFFFCHHFVSLF